jgi:ppGpp synthetase/RelA/SpoT-type nucleotidyltranferase
MTSSKPIEAFMNAYNFDYHVKVAKQAEQTCRKVLEDHKIPAIITSRAKDKTSLLNKLNGRNAQRKGGPYKNGDEIKKDLVDLVGFRVALYIPDQLVEALKALAGVNTLGGASQQVSQALAGADPKAYPFLFENLEDKKIHAGNEGYKATHLRVKLNPKYETFKGTSDGQLVIEIQMQTVVMHTWAQIGHDLEYKKLNGELSADENQGLINLNTHMREAEKIINAIHDATQKRLNNAKVASLPKYRFFEDDEVD